MSIPEILTSYKTIKIISLTYSETTNKQTQTKVRIYLYRFIMFENFHSLPFTKLAGLISHATLLFSIPSQTVNLGLQI